MKITDIQFNLKELDTEHLQELDKALGAFHEHLPQLYAECGFGKLQALNTSELSNR